MSQPRRIALFLALAALPLLEIVLLIRIGQDYGFGRLALWVILSAVAGTLVIRRVGLSVFNQVLAREREGSPSMEPLFDGFFQVLAGLFLILPGPITDVAGLLLLVPQIRQKLITSGILKLVRFYHYQAEVSRESFGTRPTADEGPAAPGVTIEGEYERLDERTVRPGTAVEPRPVRKRG